MLEIVKDFFGNLFLKMNLTDKKETNELQNTSNEKKYTCFNDNEGNKYLINFPQSVSEANRKKVYSVIYSGVKHNVPIEMVVATATCILNDKGYHDVEAFLIDQKKHFIKITVILNDN